MTDKEKLAKIKKIEKKLGIDLITLDEAMKNGIFVKIGDKIYKKEVVCISFNKHRETHYVRNGICHDVKGCLTINAGDYGSRYLDFHHAFGYGEEWALTEKELTMKKEK